MRVGCVILNMDPFQSLFFCFNQILLILVRPLITPVFMVVPVFKCHIWYYMLLIDHNCYLMSTE